MSRASDVQGALLTRFGTLAAVGIAVGLGTYYVTARGEVTETPPAQGTVALPGTEAGKLIATVPAHAGTKLCCSRVPVSGTPRLYCTDGDKAGWVVWNTTTEAELVAAGLDGACMEIVGGRVDVQPKPVPP